MKIKKLFLNLIWVVVSILFAISFAVVAGAFGSTEKINAIWLLTAAGCFYVLSYRFYSAFIASKVLALNDSKKTPAYVHYDGKNFYPTNKWVLFGHHFAAIAGAGPLIGPVLAAQFGFLPGFLWLLIGSVFAGAVHDFVILVASIRRGGKSLAQIAREEVGAVTGWSTMVAVLFVLIIANAGLSLAVINSLFNNPWGTFIIGMTIPIALFMGFYMKTLRPNKVGEVSLIGITLLVLTVVFGKYVPGTAFGEIFNLNKNSLTVLIVMYGFIASVLPVWLLLAPRDYLSSFMKIGVIGMLVIGVFVVAPEIHMPRTTIFMSGGGPVIPGKIFPFLFIIIACGAISGFHALISSGTTPKMIEKETYARSIGYGAMLTESFISMMALIAATVLIPGDYFAINTTLSFQELQSMGFPVSNINELSSIIGVDLAGRPGGAVSLAVGISYIFGAIPFLKHLMTYWYQFALMFEALFILTTVDAGTRVARYVLQEIGGQFHKPMGNLNSLKWNIAASLLVVLTWGYFVHTGSVATIWPMFGTANQLLSVLALCIGTSLLIKKGKVKYVWVTLIPMIFMAVVTFTASVYLISEFSAKIHAGVGNLTTFKINIVLMITLIILSCVILIDSFMHWARMLKKGSKL